MTCCHGLDGLFLISQDPDLIKGYELAVLTPNSVEFSRLRVAAGLADEKGDISTHHVKELARAMVSSVPITAKQ